MTDQRNRRAWVRVQPPDTPPGYEVARIVGDWKRPCRATINLMSAIRWYVALLAGDTSVLFELFPGLDFTWAALHLLDGNFPTARRPARQMKQPIC